MFLIANPDVPSVRNAQRLLERVRQLGAAGERVRFVLNRAAEPYPIPPKQIEGALGHPIHHTFPSDYKTVSTALNSGVPLALAGNTEIAIAVRRLHAPHHQSGRRLRSAGASETRRQDGSRAHRVTLVNDHGHSCSQRPAPRRRRPLPGPARPAAVSRQYAELKANVHRKLLNRLNLEALAQADRSRAESEIRSLLGELLSEENIPISLGEREGLFGELVDDVFGLGPLEPLLRDPAVSDILVNTYKNVFVERGGQIERVTATFQDDKHLMRVIDRIVSGVGRRVDDSSPMVDARLQDGSRVNAIIPPLAVDGPLLSIRRFPAERLKADDLVTLKALTRPMLDFLSHCVRVAAELPDQRRHRRRQDDAAQRAVRATSATRNASSPSRTRPSCSCTRITWRGSKRVRRTSKARAPSASGSSSSTRSVCAPTASSSVRSAARKRSTCCRP